MTALLSLNQVHSYYGSAHILHGLGLQVHAGERVALIGRNGVGKTTVVNTILGLAQMKEGTIHFGSTSIARPRPYIAAQHGIVVVPQGRRIVANLTVEENLRLGLATSPKGTAKPPQSAPAPRSRPGSRAGRRAGPAPGYAAGAVPTSSPTGHWGP